MANVSFHAFVRDHLSWYADDNCIVRDIAGYDTSCPDCNIVANMNRSDYMNSRADVNVVANDWITFPGPTVGLAERHVLTDVTIRADDAVCINHDSPKMADVKAGADLSVRRNLDAEFNHVMAMHQTGQD